MYIIFVFLLSSVGAHYHHSWCFHHPEDCYHYQRHDFGHHHHNQQNFGYQQQAEYPGPPHFQDFSNIYQSSDDFIPPAFPTPQFYTPPHIPQPNLLIRPNYNYQAPLFGQFDHSEAATSTKDLKTASSDSESTVEQKKTDSSLFSVQDLFKTKSDHPEHSIDLTPSDKYFHPEIYNTNGDNSETSLDLTPTSSKFPIKTATSIKNSDETSRRDYSESPFDLTPSFNPFPSNTPDIKVSSPGIPENRDSSTVKDDPPFSFFPEIYIPNDEDSESSIDLTPVEFPVKTTFNTKNPVNSEVSSKRPDLPETSEHSEAPPNYEIATNKGTDVNDIFESVVTTVTQMDKKLQKLCSTQKHLKNVTENRKQDRYELILDLPAYKEGNITIKIKHTVMHINAKSHVTDEDFNYIRVLPVLCNFSTTSWRYVGDDLIITVLQNDGSERNIGCGLGADTEAFLVSYTQYPDFPGLQDKSNVMGVVLPNFEDSQETHAVV